MIVQVRNLRVAAVNCQRVLNQVVRADTEEVDVFGKRGSHDCRRRSFNHDADLHAVGILFAFVNEFGFRVFDELFRGKEFLHVDDHREHNRGFTVNAGAENRLQLRHEQIFALQADTNCAVAEERVFFLADLDVRKRFVAADIHCADNAETFAVSDRGAVFDGSFVFFELIFFLRNVGFAHEDEFGAEQTDTRRTVIFNGGVSVRG